MPLLDPAPPNPASPPLTEPGTQPVAVPTNAGRGWIAPVAAGFGLLAATAYTWAANPNTSAAFPICPLRALTGVDCPMCGGLRSVHALTHFDLVAAIDHNIVLVLALPFMVLAYGLWLGRSLGWSVPKVTVSPRVTLILIGLLVLYGVVRNLPIPGHDLLNSTAMLSGRT